MGGAEKILGRAEKLWWGLQLPTPLLLRLWLYATYVGNLESNQTDRASKVYDFG